MTPAFSRNLTLLNLAGVLALAGFCTWQWHNENRLIKRINILLKIQATNEHTIAEQKNTIAGLSADLAIFKQRYAETSAKLDETEDTLRVTQYAKARLETECEQLREAVKRWETAVKMRDERIAADAERFKILIGHLNDSIRRLNDLTAKYNELVNVLNKTRRELAQVYKDLDTTRRKLYEALGQQLPPPESETPSKAGTPPKAQTQPSAGSASTAQK